MPGNHSTEYYVARVLRYVAACRLVIEWSYQIPVIRDTIPQVPGIGGNLLTGIRYFY